MPPICTTILPILKALLLKEITAEKLCQTHQRNHCVFMKEKKKKKNFLQRLAAASCIRNLIFQLHFQALIQYENTKIYQDFPSCLLEFKLELFRSYVCISFEFSSSIKYKRLPDLEYFIGLFHLHSRQLKFQFNHSLTYSVRF